MWGSNTLLRDHCAAGFCYCVSMERPAKLRRLNDFRRKLPHLTASALAAVLLAVSLEGLPDVFDRNSIRQSRDQIGHVDATPFGPVVQSITVFDTNDSPMDIPIANPFANLWTAIRTCSNFQALIMDRLLAKPCSYEQPWNLILYSDEVTPGNPLSTANKRKIQAVYYSFLEFSLSDSESS